MFRQIMEQNFKFISFYLRGSDLPEGKAVKFRAVGNKDKQVWGYRESKGQFGLEVQFPGGIKKIEFFLSLQGKDGQSKEFTRNSKGFWETLQKMNLKEGDYLTITRVGEDKNSRYSILKAEKDSPEEQTEPEEENPLMNEEEKEQLEEDEHEI